MITAKDLVKEHEVVVDVNDTVAQLLGKFNQTEDSALVFDGKKYLGLVEKRLLVANRIDLNKMKVKNVIKKRSKSKTQF